MIKLKSHSEEVQLLLETIERLVSQISWMRDEYDLLQAKMSEESVEADEQAGLVSKLSQALASERAVCDKLYQHLAEIKLFGAGKESLDDLFERYQSLRQTYAEIGK